MDSNHKREVCFLLGRGGEILYADFSASPFTLPDSRKRWQVIWKNRQHLVEVGHSHPVGTSRFSSEDETTMNALDRALGRSLRYSVVAPTEMRVREGDTEYKPGTEPWWTGLMRLASGMECIGHAGSNGNNKGEKQWQF